MPINSSCRDASGRNVKQSAIKQSGASSINNSYGTQASSSMAEWLTSSSQRPCSSSRAVHITKLLVNCVTSDFQPLSFCEDESMRALLLFLEPNYQPPTHSTLQSHVSMQYENKRKELLTRLWNIPDCAATCDVWTNQKMVSFFSIMIHYIDEDWNTRAVNLASPMLKEKHTADNLAKLFDEACCEASLKVFCCTHDTAANMNRCLRQSKCTRFDIGCLAHILQLAISDALSACPAMNEILKKIKKIIAAIRKSETLSRQLRQTRDQLLPAAKKRELQLNNATRWNSDVIMVESFLTLYPAIDFMMKTPEAKNDKTFHKKNDGRDKFVFLPQDVKAAEDLITLLEHLKSATDEWQAEKTVSISAVYPILFAVRRKLRAFSTLSLSSAGQALRDALLHHLEIRFNMTDEPFLSSLSVHMIASYLDPRFKKLSFVSESVKSGIRRVIEEELQHLPEDDERVEPEPAQKKTKMSKLALLLDDDATVENAAECARYEAEPCISVDENPLLWWKGKQKTFPKLAMLARRYLQVQATSASSERLFSSFGHVFEDKRMSLDACAAEKIIFLHCNFQL
jgi:hypothetical protein